MAIRHKTRYASTLRMLVPASGRYTPNQYGLMVVSIIASLGFIIHFALNADHGSKDVYGLLTLPDPAAKLVP
jgi:hypothetical protein